MIAAIELLLLCTGTFAFIAWRESVASKKAKIAALKHAIYICETRKTVLKNPAYNVACDDIKLFLAAAISRVEDGEDMAETATVQS